MKRKRPSIYEHKIRKIHVTHSCEANEQEDYAFHLYDNWVKRLQTTLEEFDFYDYHYLQGGHAYWCGILTAEPFDSLLNKYGDEESILNEIKNHHLQFIERQNGEVLLQFINPTKSPLYRFFNRYKEDGYGDNIPYSINQLMNTIEKYLTEKLINELDEYGEWQPYVDEYIA